MRIMNPAIANFNTRAKLVSEQMQSSGFRLVQMSINTSGTSPRPYMARGMQMEMKSVAAPALEAGTQQVQVNISGTIELIRQ